MKLKISLLFCWMMVATLGMAQPPENWFNLDPKKDGVPGLSTEKMYKELLKDKKGQTVIVAVLDSGVDHEHEDLRDVMWVNKGEVPGNGKDDDGNGYVDDIHGWSFLGGKDGKNVRFDNLEITRLYRKYKPIYENANRDKLSKKQQKEYDAFVQMGKDIDKKTSKLEKDVELYGGILNAVTTVKKEVGKDEVTLEDVEKIETEDPTVSRSVMIVSSLLAQGLDFAEVEEEVTGAYDYFYNQLNYYYNPDFDPRHIIGDNYANSYDKNYGNADSHGPDPEHGTHVAGIIGAVRTNDIGMKGVADNVQIMSVRCVPDGDERDKDVANAIRYAVDNGASIINMSFGKGYAWDKQVVDEAVKYALKNDVLLVHAAGNSNQNNDTENNFPNDKFKKKGLFGPKNAKNWLEVGALSWKGGEDLPASFSNYGKDNVDVFAPGVEIYSTTPDDHYEPFPGTSMASPMVAGTAAVLRSYFPTLTAKQVKEIIMSSAIPQNTQVKQPGTGAMVPFSQLSVTGGILSAYNAVQMAAKTKGKKKMNAGKNGSYNSGKNSDKDKKKDVATP